MIPNIPIIFLDDMIISHIFSILPSPLLSIKHPVSVRHPVPFHPPTAGEGTQTSARTGAEEVAPRRSRSR